MRKYRGPILLGMLTLFFFIGCNSTLDYQSCINDPECKEQIQMVNDQVQISATTVANQNPVLATFSIAIGTLAGAVVSYVTGVVKGKKIGSQKRRSTDK